VDDDLHHHNPIDFPVNRLIPGVAKAVQLMEQGRIHKLFVPLHLTFREKGWWKISLN